jgi:hypothetical protein
MAVDYFHRLLITGPRGNLLLLRKRVARRFRGAFDRQKWSETIPFSFVQLCKSERCRAGKRSCDTSCTHEMWRRCRMCAYFRENSRQLNSIWRPFAGTTARSRVTGFTLGDPASGFCRINGTKPIGSALVKNSAWPAKVCLTMTMLGTSQRKRRSKTRSTTGCQIQPSPRAPSPRTPPRLAWMRSRTSSMTLFRLVRPNHQRQRSLFSNSGAHAAG